MIRIVRTSLSDYVVCDEFRIVALWLNGTLHLGYVTEGGSLVWV